MKKHLILLALLPLSSYANSDKTWDQLAMCSGLAQYLIFDHGMQSYLNKGVAYEVLSIQAHGGEFAKKEVVHEAGRIRGWMQASGHFTDGDLRSTAQRNHALGMYADECE